MTCPTCHAEVPEGTAVCVQCGTDLATGQAVAGSEPSPPAVPATERPFSKLAIAALIFAVVFWPIGFLLAIAALYFISRDNLRGRTLAIIATFVSVLWFLLSGIPLFL